MHHATFKKRDRYIDTVRLGAAAATATTAAAAEARGAPHGPRPRGSRPFRLGGRQAGRRLCRLCANMGGYPDGLPCTFELLAMEVAWVLGYV